MSGIDYGYRDKVVLVTGGSRGVGCAIARRLLEQGARVTICSRKPRGLEEACGELGCEERLLAVNAHIAREDDVDRLFDAVGERFGHLDVLINNVGMNLPVASVSDADPELWRKIVDTNLNGTYYCSRHAARMMRPHRQGCMVNISSLAGHRASPGMGIYGVAKAGVEMLTRVLAAELAADGIRVNAVAPAMVRTGFSRPFWSEPGINEQIVRTIPLGRIAEPADVVEPVLFLASEAAAFITGQTLVVDGGASAV